MDEGRKRTIGIIAAILAARRLAALGDRPSPAIDATIADCIATAERILRKIDSLHPTTPTVGSGSQSITEWGLMCLALNPNDNDAMPALIEKLAAKSAGALPHAR